MDNEEKPEEIEKEPEEEEKAGRIHYKMEYNFNSQELTVTVSFKHFEHHLAKCQS